jgi:hypothetical protein
MRSNGQELGKRRVPPARKIRLNIKKTAGPVPAIYSTYFFEKVKKPHIVVIGQKGGKLIGVIKNFEVRSKVMSRKP